MKADRSEKKLRSPEHDGKSERIEKRERSNYLHPSVFSPVIATISMASVHVFEVDEFTTT